MNTDIGKPPATAAMGSAVSVCALCETAGGELIWTGQDLRVVLVDDPAYPGFTRVICRDHVAEMTDLAEPKRAAMMAAVWAVESAQRAVLAPHKVNLASLGNMVPHMHWHVIPRWRDDACFPDAIWAPVRRGDGSLGDGAGRARALLADYVQALRTALDEIFPGD